MAIGELRFVKVLLLRHQGKGDARELSCQNDFCSDFRVAFVDLRVIVIVEALMTARWLSSTVEQSPQF